MIYAQVAVDRKIADLDTLTYSLTPQHLLNIKEGSLVEVSVRGKLAKGIVVKLTKTKAAGIKNLLPIKRIISKNPVITTHQLILTDWLSNYYGVSLGEAMFTMVPKLGIKELENKND